MTAVEPKSEARTASQKKRRRFVKHWRRKAGRWAAITIGPLVVRVLASTWRVAIEHEDHVDRARGEGGGHIMALWHGRMLIPVTHFARRGYHVLVSKSGDGDVSEALLSRVGYGIVRGSSRGGGTKALRALIELLRSGAGIAITPDGPIGPRHSFTPSVAWMAKATGYAVVPCGFVAGSAWRLSSWDRFTIPKPFARVALVFGEPVHVPREARDDELAHLGDTIRERMLAAEQRGFVLLGAESDW